MKLYIWQGDERNLGRFGAVKKGDPLAMTEAEAAYVEQHKDKNYRRAKGQEVIAADAPEHLRKAADTAVISALELRQLNHDGLVKRCERMKANNIPICFKLASSRQDLIAAILLAERHSGVN
jgi:hypothetical protein